MAAKFQVPLVGQFMNVKPRTLHVAALALRIVPTRTLTAHETPVLTRFEVKFIGTSRGFDLESAPFEQIRYALRSRTPARFALIERHQ